jgi:hypothetical protein
MGLGLEIGFLATAIADEDDELTDELRSNFAAINVLLKARGFAEHLEPETGIPSECRNLNHSFPYSFIHHLRRVAAKVQTDPSWQFIGLKEGVDPTEDPALIAETAHKKSHLIWHSDCDGYYIPIDFPVPLIKDVTSGDIIGSSQGLLRELIAIAPTLGINLHDNKLSNAESDRLNNIIRIGEEMEIELYVWTILFELASLSIEHRTAIVFC